MKCLVDANVLSEATKPQPDARVLHWLTGNQALLVVNPIILGELQYGILKLPDGHRRKGLLDWFAQGAKHLPSVEIDTTTASCWAHLMSDLRRQGLAMPIKDSLIAASALQYGFAVATRNTRDFEASKVPLVNPFESP